MTRGRDCAGISRPIVERTSGSRSGSVPCIDEGGDPAEAIAALGLTEADARALAHRIGDATRHARVKLEPDSQLARVIAAIDGGGRDEPRGARRCVRTVRCAVCEQVTYRKPSHRPVGVRKCLHTPRKRSPRWVNSRGSGHEEEASRADPPQRSPRARAEHPPALGQPDSSPATSRRKIAPGRRGTAARC